MNREQGFWCVAFCVGALVAGVLAGPAYGAMIQIDLVATPSSVTAGGTVEVAVLADIVSPVIGYGFNIVFDGALLRLDSVSVPQPFVSLASAVPGASVLALAYPNNAVGTDVVLAKAHFTSLATGSAQVNISVNPGDLTQGFAEMQVGAFAQFAVTPAQISITAEAPPSPPSPGPVVPEPTTFLILAGGAALLWLPRAWLARRPA